MVRVTFRFRFSGINSSFGKCFKVGPGFRPVLPFRGRGCGRRTAGRSACPRLRSGKFLRLRAGSQFYGMRFRVSQETPPNWGQPCLFPLWWGYYPTFFGKVHKPSATAPTVAHRGSSRLGSAARNARDARFWGRFSASLAALTSLDRCTVPPPAAVRCCGSCERSLPDHGDFLSSGSSAVSTISTSR